MPENIGVKPEKSMATSAASGRIRYQFSFSARHGFGALLLRQADQVLAAGFQVRHPEGGDVVEDGWNGRRLDDLGVGYVEVLGHDEGDCAHHRRHYLAAHRRGGLDGAGEDARVAEALHQRES